VKAPIRCIICDLDGTLVSTHEANYQAYRGALAECGRDLGREAYARAFGLRAEELLDAVAPGLSDTEIAAVRRRKTALYRDRLSLVDPNRMLLGFLRAMKPALKLALASTASRVNAELVLGHVGALSLFDERVFGEDVRRGKPDPECYLLCMARCGVEPAECLVFEDSEVGIRAAAAAGSCVLKVPSWN
jgi:HAD superfamily hydrolase (TIGR01509 family)